jgi:hypothetical protein
LMSSSDCLGFGSSGERLGMFYFRRLVHGQGSGAVRQATYQT